jgi:biofilm PGA synthesis N-glycosyltransferase PgaC
MKTAPKYVVVSPMNNEEKYVAKTLEAMVSQTILPMEWVIVNDGSTDRSAEIVTRYCERFPWIRLVHKHGSVGRTRGGHVVDLVYEGLNALRSSDYEFLVKLDCDLSFEATFFETILHSFMENPKLGITSGISFAFRGGVLEEEKGPPGHTLGATKVYRRQCFQDIGGLVRSMGWDGLDEIKARMLGWEARPLRKLIVVHYRPEGAAKGLLASGVERGRGSYFMGYHPVFLMARAMRRMLKPGLFTDGVGMLAGYFWSMLRRESRMPDAELIRVLRKSQVRELLLLRREA